MIKMRNVCKYFDEFQVLNQLNLTVKKGSIYGLVGVNGSGKTTLIKHLSGICCPDSGDVLIDNQPVFDNVKIKEKIGYISDDLYFFALYHLKSFSKFCQNLYPNWDQSRYTYMVQQFGLNETKKLSKFSKGMQKQAAFILAMSAKPEILILDEPLDGLDPMIRKLVLKYIVDDVTERKMTVLISSHNLKEIEGICDSIGILNNGSMLIEKDLDALTSDIHKIQIIFPEGTVCSFENLNVLFHEKRGSVNLLIIRGKHEVVEETLLSSHPIVLDLLPLTLEEIFIYEMGGDRHAIKEILF